MLIGVFAVVFFATLSAILNGAITRSEVQEKGSDAGLAIFSTIIPIAISAMMFIAGILSDISYDYLFVVVALLTVYMLYQQNNKKSDALFIPKCHSLTKKGKHMLLMNFCINAGFAVVLRLVKPLYIVSVAQNLGFDGHVLKILGLVTAVVMLVSLLQKAFKSKVNKWALNTRSILYLGAGGYSLMIFMWGVSTYFYGESYYTLIIVFLALVFMQMLAVSWNTGFFGEFRKATPNVEKQSEIYRSYMQAFSFALASGSAFGLFLSGLLYKESANNIPLITLVVGTWCLVVVFIYWLWDRPKTSPQ